MVLGGVPGEWDSIGKVGCKMNKIQQKAAEALKHFERKSREDGTGYWKLTENRPDWVYDLVYDAHDDMLPDDWKYQMIWKVLSALSEDECDPHDYYCVLEESYFTALRMTSDLLGYLKSHGERIGRVDDLLEEASKGGGHYRTISDLISAAWLHECQEVWGSVVHSLEEQVEKEEE